MTIHENLKAGIPTVIKARDEVRLRTLRSLVAAMTNEVVAKKRKPDEFLTDDEALIVLKRASNQRKDSIEQFSRGGRIDLIGPEKEELTIIEALLPEQMSEKDIEAVVSAQIIELAADRSKVGMLTGAVMKELKGRADGAVVKSVIDRLLV